jgi:hypothetical protein
VTVGRLLSGITVRVTVGLLSGTTVMVVTEGYTVVVEYTVAVTVGSRGVGCPVTTVMYVTVTVAVDEGVGCAVVRYMVVTYNVVVAAAAHFGSAFCCAGHQLGGLYEDTAAGRAGGG